MDADWPEGEQILRRDTPVYQAPNFTTYERLSTSTEELALTATAASLASIRNATQHIRAALSELEGDEPPPRNFFG